MRSHQTVKFAKLRLVRWDTSKVYSYEFYIRRSNGIPTGAYRAGVYGKGK